MIQRSSKKTDEGKQFLPSPLLLAYGRVGNYPFISISISFVLFPLSSSEVMPHAVGSLSLFCLSLIFSLSLITVNMG